MIPATTKEDATWYFSVVMVWSDAEVSSAIIALSLPALKGLYTLLSKGGSRNRTSPGNSNSLSLKPFGSSGHKRIINSNDGDSESPNVENADNLSKPVFAHGRQRSVAIRETEPNSSWH